MLRIFFVTTLSIFKTPFVLVVLVKPSNLLSQINRIKKTDDIRSRKRKPKNPNGPKEPRKSQKQKNNYNAALAPSKIERNTTRKWWKFHKESNVFKCLDLEGEGGREGGREESTSAPLASSRTYAYMSLFNL